MATFRCVMFGHILYDEKLTWQELREAEARVTTLMQTALEECDAQHIDFTAQGDALLVECVFPDMNRDNNHALCDTVIRQLGPGVLARFMFMDRQMDSAAFYFLGRGKWQEQALSVPGPKEALSGWVVRQERKNKPERRDEPAWRDQKKSATRQGGDLLETTNDAPDSAESLTSPSSTDVPNPTLTPPKKKKKQARQKKTGQDI